MVLAELMESSDLLLACAWQLGGRRLNKETMVSASTIVPGESCPLISPSSPFPEASQFNPPICPLWFLSHCPSIGAQRELVCEQMSLCVVSFKLKEPGSSAGLGFTYPLSLLVFTARYYSAFVSWHWNTGLGGWCGSETLPSSWDFPPVS